MEEKTVETVSSQSDQKLLQPSNIIIGVSGIFFAICIGAALFFTFGILPAIIAGVVTLLIAGLILVCLNIDILCSGDSSNQYTKIEDNSDSSDNNNKPLDLTSETKKKTEPNTVNQYTQTPIHYPPVPPPPPPKQTSEPQIDKEKLAYDALASTIEEHKQALTNLARSLPGNNIMPAISLLEQSPENGYEHCIKTAMGSIKLSDKEALIANSKEIENELNNHFAALQNALKQQHQSPYFFAQERAREEDIRKDNQRREAYEERLSKEGLNILIENLSGNPQTPF